MSHGTVMVDSKTDTATEFLRQLAGLSPDGWRSVEAAWQQLKSSPSHLVAWGKAMDGVWALVDKSGRRPLWERFAREAEQRVAPKVLEALRDDPLSPKEGAGRAAELATVSGRVAGMLVVADVAPRSMLMVGFWPFQHVMSLPVIRAEHAPQRSLTRAEQWALSDRYAVNSTVPSLRRQALLAMLLGSAASGVMTGGIVFVVAALVADAGTAIIAAAIAGMTVMVIYMRRRVGGGTWR